MQIHRGRDPYWSGYWQRKEQAYQPLPFVLHITLCSVSEHHKQNLDITNLDSGRFIEYLLERADVKPAWKAHTEHAFLAKLANATLPLENFKNYLIQDYLYLVRL